MRIFIGLFLVLFVVGCKNRATEPHPEALKLFLPKGGGGDSVPAHKPEHAFTVILSDDNNVYYYSGEFDSNVKVEKTKFKKIRHILSNKKKELNDNLIVIIKGDAKATYKNTVDMLDEMAINDIKRYVLVDITNEELKRLGLDQNNF